jgi:hypothetical protein
MMIVTGKYLERRTVLRGMGASIALPLLDGMVPAFASDVERRRRFCAVFIPMGMSMPYWTPKTDGALEISPILEPLRAFKDRMIVVSGCDNAQVEAAADGGIHPRSQTGWLTGVLAKRTEGVDFRAATSLDQHVAQEFGKQTQLGSLEVSLDDVSVSAGTFPGYTHVYLNTISWRTPTMPLPMEVNPRAVFERLFGVAESTDRAARVEQNKRNKSLLDAVSDKIAALDKRLDARDRAKLNEHLESVRDVERRIQMAESQVDAELPTVERPRGVPATFEEHAKIMFDLQVLALKTDLTRVTSFMYGREGSPKPFPEIGIPEPWHPVSHHNNEPAKLLRQSKLNIYHMTLFQHFLEQMQATKDGNGTLLDDTVILFGSGLSDSNLHSAFNLPTIVVSGRGIDMKVGRHLRVPKDTPFSNLQLTLLDKLNVRGVEHFGNSTGKFDGMVSL